MELGAFSVSLAVKDIDASKLFFTDVRTWQRHLKDHGVSMLSEAHEGLTGPASLTLADPDGNVILMDQHV